jgi:hypothetical protein
VDRRIVEVPDVGALGPQHDEAEQHGARDHQEWATF